LTAAERTAFGVYVHWPFCLSKCPYCDFNSHVRHAAIDEGRFAEAFAREIATTAARTGKRDVTSIFLGGGTPSLMRPETVGSVLDTIGKFWRVAPDVEVTLEANPTSVEATRFAGYRAAGVNRVSLGVQALDDASLKELGRLHSAREALDAVAIARQSFDRYSFDLIYARPGQAPQAWRDELALAIKEAAEHLSLYQLTIEEGTPFFGLHAAGKLKTPDEALARALYDVTQDVCAKHGLPAYEISNHARKGAECRHNLVYWRGEEYAGVGPGAHGRLDIGCERHAAATEKLPPVVGAVTTVVEEVPPSLTAPPGSSPPPPPPPSPPAAPPQPTSLPAGSSPGSPAAGGSGVLLAGLLTLVTGSLPRQG